jgi:hypothetical protein
VKSYSLTMGLINLQFFRATKVMLQGTSLNEIAEACNTERVRRLVYFCFEPIGKALAQAVVGRGQVLE